MTLLQTQLMKNMKQITLFSATGLKSLCMMSLYGVSAAAFLWLIHMVTAPMGGIVLFSSVFIAAIAGFAAAVTLYHAATKLPQWVSAVSRQKQSA
jgi:hypothetical protein